MIFPYLLLGTLGSFGLRYRWVNKLRPFIDAIHCSYKDNRRYWFGMRLILLVIVYITNAILRGRYPHEQLLLTLVLLVTFTTVQAYIRPFQKNLVGILDTWLMFNTILLVIINLYNALGGNSAVYLLITNLIIVLFTATAVVIGHIVMLVKHIKVKPKPVLKLAEHSITTTNSESPRVTMSIVSHHKRPTALMAPKSIQNLNDGYSMSTLREPLLDECD